MKSILLKKALRQTFNIKKGWETIATPLPIRNGEEQ